VGEVIEGSMGEAGKGERGKQGGGVGVGRRT